MNAPRILVVHRRSTYTAFVSQRRSSRMSRLAKRRDPLIARILLAHENHLESMAKVRAALKVRRIPAVFRHDISGLDPDSFDLVVTVGGDGTVLHASHSIGSTPVLGVNSSPSTSVGFFTAACASDFGDVLDAVLGGRVRPIPLTRMEVRVNSVVVTRRALNDVLFCHDCPASTTRYILTHGALSEDQLSSGVWVATAAGSTAAIRAAGGRPMSPRSKRLQFAVREPIVPVGASPGGRLALVRGVVARGDTLAIRSKTQAARLYVDGPHVVFPVSFGDGVAFSAADTPLLLFGSAS